MTSVTSANYLSKLGSKMIYLSQLLLLFVLLFVSCSYPTAPAYYLKSNPAIQVTEPRYGAVFLEGMPIHIRWEAFGRADTLFKASVLRRVDGGKWGDKTEEGVLLHGTRLVGNEVIWENWELSYLGTIPDGYYVIRIESDTLYPEQLRAWGESGKIELRRN